MGESLNFKPKYSVKVVSKSLTNGAEKIHDSMTDCAKYLGCCRESLRDCIKRQGTCKNHKITKFIK